MVENWEPDTMATESGEASPTIRSAKLVLNCKKKLMIFINRTGPGAV